MELSRYLPRTLPPPIAGLMDLALDVRWSWNRSSDQLWRALDPQLWDERGNPWMVLNGVSYARLEALAGDEAFVQTLQAQLTARNAYLQDAAWFGENHSGENVRVAYFSMEFGLSESLPIYSGGLGMLAGDDLKAASDLGVPLVGVGLLYQQGYFHQSIDASGRQLEFYPYNNPSMLPIVPVRDAGGDWLQVAVELPGRTLRLYAWQARVGRVALYLLDSNHPLNTPADRGITGELYGGGPETRLEQEIVLGIGGWRLLELLGLHCDVCHLNEGHAAFAVLERARGAMVRHGIDFATALRATRAGNIFTTHTPVPAGFDRFPAALMAQYLSGYIAALEISLDELLALGRSDPGDHREPFNMAFLAMRGAGLINGVSRLHGRVSRGIFQPLFPRWPQEDVPVGHVTNGVHVSSWNSMMADELWSSAGVAARWTGTHEGPEERLRAFDTGELWAFRTRSREELVRSLRLRVARQHASRGATAEQTAACASWLETDILTLGFARRFAAYKRPTLLLHDPARLARLLTHSECPIQLVIAGKAHPHDEDGKRMIKAWIDFISHAQLFHRVVFIEDYDMALAAELVQGVDVWLNTPRRPWEASGTSGMKVLVNGGLNCSELDGWWAEAYEQGIGWAIGDGQEHGNDSRWDAQEADQLYSLLEEEIAPAFYSRDERGIPMGWTERMRRSMAGLTPRFSANRMVREYVELYYLAAAKAYRERIARNAALAAQLQAWESELNECWGALRFEKMEVQSTDGGYLFNVDVNIGTLSAQYIRVELYAEAATEQDLPERHTMERVPASTGDVRILSYALAIVTARPADHYTPRIVPFHPQARVPLEATHIRWHP